jgi:hypothetical protein
MPLRLLKKRASCSSSSLANLHGKQHITFIDVCVYCFDAILPAVHNHCWQTCKRSSGGKNVHAGSTLHDAHMGLKEESLAPAAQHPCW